MYFFKVLCSFSKTSRTLGEKDEVSATLEREVSHEPRFMTSWEFATITRIMGRVTCGGNTVEVQGLRYGSFLWFSPVLVICVEL